ncbi:hypothetical protein GIX45_16085 [Erwinia sp. CPCC 100877]|nr:hypothetical protein [Erwinia sp. CPCC 100877]
MEKTMNKKTSARVFSLGFESNDYLFIDELERFEKRVNNFVKGKDIVKMDTRLNGKCVIVSICWLS